MCRQVYRSHSLCFSHINNILWITITNDNNHNSHLQATTTKTKEQLLVTFTRRNHTYKNIRLWKKSPITNSTKRTQDRMCDIWVLQLFPHFPMRGFLAFATKGVFTSLR
ncbi:hypothetical protein Y032_0157g3207 [Ancylostoma ceylanicum]|uniref:Uncharacterized protein n=1 Tax=Ancylostoma ceylanicum TaxID=53326 RepID=A0A016SZ61_9BILA|nr:hypothetical protein Y032_0157g3207 [Ancylostoma ceylanicum]